MKRKMNKFIMEMLINFVFDTKPLNLILRGFFGYLSLKTCVIINVS